MRRNSAQWFCLIFGPALIVAGLAGFLVNGSFEDAEPVQGDLLLAFEVNGWHNVVHLASGLLLLAGAGRPRRARLTVLVFAIAYLAVSIAGSGAAEIFDVVPVNTEDNWLHLVLTVLAFLVAFGARRPDRRESALHPSSWGASPSRPAP